MKYRLIDGPFLLGICRELRVIEGLNPDFELNLWSLTAGAYRTIFYDALPVKKSHQSEEEFGHALSAKEAFLNRLRLYPNLQVKDGITRLRTKGKERSMSEVLEQKGVDTWIAVDAVKYALTELTNELEIITSDSDIYPVFEVLRETKAKGVLSYSVGSTRDELIFSADEARPIKAQRVLSWMGHSIQSEMHGGRINLPEVSTFDAAGVHFSIGFAGGHFLANMKFPNGHEQALRTDFYVHLFDVISDFAPHMSWSQIDSQIKAVNEYRRQSSANP